MSQTYTVNCNRVPTELSAQEVEARADALDRYLADPAVAERFPEWLHPFLKPQNNVYQPEGNDLTGVPSVRNGRWTLACTDPRNLFWMLRPSREHMLAASLAWDPDAEQWFIRGIKLSKLNRR